MRYAMFICIDGIQASDEEEALIEREVPLYVERTEAQRISGHPLLGPESATTVRVRDRQTLLTDGPFIETKEHISGFEVFECDSLEQAVEIAASMPIAWYHRIEVRACDPDHDEWTTEVRERMAHDPADGMGRYLMFVCVDPSDEQQATSPLTVEQWVEEHDASRARVVGQVLGDPEEAVTVRVRGPHTLVSDGPFAETKEFIGGFDVLECADLDAAIAVAASHPMAWQHLIELRPFRRRVADAG